MLNVFPIATAGGLVGERSCVCRLIKHDFFCRPRANKQTNKQTLDILHNEMSQKINHIIHFGNIKSQSINPFSRRKGQPQHLRKSKFSGMMGQL